MQPQRPIQESQTDRDHRPAFPASGKPGITAAGRLALTRVIEREVVPRLGARGGNPAAGGGGGPVAGGGDTAVRPGCAALIGPDEIERLVALSLEPSGRAAIDFVIELHEAGTEADTLYDDLLAPVARVLGDMWVADTCTFADVTVGTARLHAAQRLLSESFLAGTSRKAPAGRRALLMPAPGEQHSFGLSMVADHFCRAGWEARCFSPATSVRAASIVRRERPDIVGLSLACDERIGPVTDLVSRLRAVCPGIIVLAGGALFREARGPAIASAIGVDAAAGDARQAVQIADALMGGRVAAHG